MVAVAVASALAGAGCKPRETKWNSDVKAAILALDSAARAAEPSASAMVKGAVQLREALINQPGNDPLRSEAIKELAILESTELDTQGMSTATSEAVEQWRRIHSKLTGKSGAASATDDDRKRLHVAMAKMDAACESGSNEAIRSALASVHRELVTLAGKTRGPVALVLGNVAQGEMEALKANVEAGGTGTEIKKHWQRIRDRVTSAM
jgi:hypothetical protein